jgi:hypothetical protein
VTVSYCKVRATSGSDYVVFLGKYQKDSFDGGKSVAAPSNKCNLCFHMRLDVNGGESQLSLEVEKCRNEAGGERR